MRFPYLILGFLPAGIMACGTPSDGGAGRWESAVDTIGDTVVVRTLAGGVWDDTAHLVPEMTMGVLEGADEYMFGSVNAIAVAPSGEIYVTDRQVPVVRKYAPDGTHLYDLGREGGGPGEYKRPDGGLAVLSDGRVLLRDPGNTRIDVYSPDGEALTSWRLSSGLSTSRKLYVDRDDNAYAMVLLSVYSDVTEWQYGLARFTADGVHSDTLRAPTWDYEEPEISGRSENSSSSSSVPFAASTMWAYSPLGYFVGALATDYAIDLYRRDAPVLRISKEWTPVPVGAAERDEAERSVRLNFQRQFPGWKWNGPPIPGTKPPFTQLYAGDNGRIWVRVSQPGEEIMTAEEARQEEERTGYPPNRFREPAAFDVFEADGTFLGHVGAPEGFNSYPTPVFRGDYVWATMRDDLDVTTVVRFKVVLPATT